MGAFAIYTFEAGILLLSIYIVYKWLLSAENQSALNRAVLLTAYLAAFTLPLVPRPGLAGAPAAADGLVAAEAGTATGIAAQAAAVPLMRILLYVYMAGMAVTLVCAIVTQIRIAAIIRRAQPQQVGGAKVYMQSGRGLAPFSWLGHIVMNREDCGEAADMIITHERAHQRLAHWADLILADVVTVLLWYNPASWLMRSELRGVHEYQADASVLAAGFDARQYQLLLVKKAVGRGLPSLANSLNHSKLKKRITMMCNQTNGLGRRMRVLALAPALVVALAAVNNPVVASALDRASATTLTEHKVSDNVANMQAQPAPAATGQEVSDEKQPDQLPVFTGGEGAMFKFLVDNIKYPAEAVEKNQEGRVLVRFVVDAEGNVTNVEVLRGVAPSLDAESVRVVESMPRWVPAKSDGRNVSCSYVLPITYKLPKPKKAK